MLLSTPDGKVGDGAHFFRVWRDGDPQTWERAMVTIDEVEHADMDSVRQQMAMMPEAMIRQEFYAEFIQPEHSLFRLEDIEAARSSEVESFFPETTRSREVPSFFAGEVQA